MPISIEKFLNRQVDKEYISIEEARNQNLKSIGKTKQLFPQNKLAFKLLKIKI